MKKTTNSTDQNQSTIKPLRKPKSREVSSRFLSPPSPSQSQPSSSPIRHKPSLAIDNSSSTRKHQTLEDPGFIRLWPSSSNYQNNTDSTLADHLGNDRLKDLLSERKIGEKPESTHQSKNLFSLSRVRSATTVFSRFEINNGKEIKEKDQVGAKENHRPIVGGSMRYTGGKLRFLSGKSSSPSSSSLSSSNSSPSNSNWVVPGRLSVDENALFRRNPKSASFSRKKFVPFPDGNGNSESDCSASDSFSASETDSASSARKSGGAELSFSRSRRWANSDSNVDQNPVSLDSFSPRKKKIQTKNPIKRANSLTGFGNGSATSQWALSPGRTGSPPMSVESKERVMSFSSLKPPSSSSSPSRPSGSTVEKFLNLGKDFFKGKKSSSLSSSVPTTGSGNVEDIHLLRLLHNRLMQWQYVNARADAANHNVNNEVENNLICAVDGLAKLHHSVQVKKLQLQKEKLEMKLDFILHSQIKLLEAWGDIEKQHSSNLSGIKESLNFAVCRVPLIEGVKIDPQSTFAAFRHALDLRSYIKSALTVFYPSAEKIVTLLSQLAEVVSQEKLLLEECQELLHTVSTLEIQERNLKCCIIQFNSWQQQQPQHAASNSTFTSRNLSMYVQ